MDELSMLEVNPAPMLICDQQSLVLLKANAHFCELYGYTPEEITGDDITWADLHIPTSSDIGKDISEISSGSEALGKNTWEHVSKSGEKIYVKVFVREYVWQEKPVLLFTLADVTEQMHLQSKEQKEFRQKLEQSLEEKQVLIEEVHHRVKNNLAVISGLLQMQILHVDDPQLTQYIKSSQLRIQSMAIVHEMLYHSEKLTKIQMDKYVRKLTKVISETLHPDEKSIETSVDTDPIDLNINQAIPCALIISELITNSYNFAFEDKTEGLIAISVEQKAEHIKVEVKDDGIGLPDNFEEMRQKSLGLSLIDNLCRQLDTEIDISTGEWGTSFAFSFEPQNVSGSSSSNRI